MRGIKRFLGAVKEQAHLLGGLYYAWALSSAATGAAYSGYKLLITPEITGASELLFYLFVFLLVFVLILVPLLVASIFEKSGKAPIIVANPTLVVKRREVDYKISRAGFIKKQSLELYAISDTTCYRLSISLTGNAKPVVTPHGRDLTVLGPVPRGGSDRYELQFSRPMKSDETRTIAFDIEVSDPGATMRPYLTDGCHNAVSFGSFCATYVFDPAPANVFSETLTPTGESFGNIKSLLPKMDRSLAVYEVSVPSVEHRCSYTVSWVW